MSRFATTPVTLHYFSIPGRLARAGPIRLLLADAQIPFTEKLVTGDSNWPTVKGNLIQQGISPAGGLPVLQVGEEYYPQSGPTLRWLAEELGYAGASAQERYQIGAVADVAVDFATAAGPIYYSKDEAKIAEFVEKQLPRYLGAINAFLSRFHGTGPFILGEKVSYGDFVVFSVFRDRNLPKEVYEQFPRVNALVQAVQERKNVNAWLKGYFGEV